MIICFKIESHNMSDYCPLDEFACSFDCTFFKFICLTAKALRRVTMCDFLVGATGPEKRTLNMPFFINDLRYKRAQLRIPG